jgi:hypothetical protein
MAGTTFMAFSQPGVQAPTVSLSGLNGANGFRVEGVSAGDVAGYSVSAAGDLNGDGFGDLIIGALGANSVGQLNAGIAYVIFGHAGEFSAVVAQSTLNGTNGFWLNGAATDDGAGNAVSAAGDVNGDGYDDLVVSAPFAGPGCRGSVYLVFGRASGFASRIELSALDGTNGFELRGAGGSDLLGISPSSLAAAGDVNADGYDDLVIGSSFASPNADYSGAAYVIFGGNFTAAVTQAGTAAGETLTGTAATDRIIAFQDDDVIIGGGGADAPAAAAEMPNWSFAVARRERGRLQRAVEPEAGRPVERRECDPRPGSRLLPSRRRPRQRHAAVPDVAHDRPDAGILG